MAHKCHLYVFVGTRKAIETVRNTEYSLVELPSRFHCLLLASACYVWPLHPNMQVSSAIGPYLKSTDTERD